MAKVITAEDKAATEPPREGEQDQVGASEATPATAAPEFPTSQSPVRLRQMMGRYSGPKDIDGQLRLAASLAKAKRAIPWEYRDNEGDILAFIQQAKALDIELAVALDNIHFNKYGVAGMRARLMHALVLRAGHRVEVVSADERMVRMRLVRTDGKPGGSAKWTIAEAQRAGLVKPDTDNRWYAYPGDLLWARCTSRLTRRWAPDVTLGMYEVSELADITGVDDDVLDPADMSTAVTDADGRLLPAPDVMRLLEGLDVATLPEVRNRWKIASEEGLLGAFAGEVDGVHHTVEELLVDRASAAEAEQEQARRSHGKPAGKQEGKPAGKPDSLPDSKPAEDAPAGTGDQLGCGCNPQDVVTNGAHAPGCALTGGGAR